MIGLLFRVLKFAAGYQSRILGASILSFLKSMISKTPFFVAFVMISAFLEGRVNGGFCLAAAMVLVLSVIVQSLLQHGADRLQSAAGFEIFAEKRKELGAHLRKLPMGYFTEGNIGKISSVLSTDMLFIEENLMMVLGDLMSYLFSALIFVVIMFLFDYRMGLLALFITLLMYSLGEAMKKSQLKHSAERQAANQELTDAVLDFTEGIGIIKTYNLLGDRSKTLSDSFAKSCRKNLAFEESHAPWALAINLTYGLGSVSMLGLGWMLYQKGVMTGMMLIGFLFFVYELFQPIKAFYGQITRLTVMSACLDRIEAIFQESPLDDSGTEIDFDPDAPEIEFIDVTFAYDSKREVLHDVSFKLPRNTMTALVGPSGGGKSTIASLVPRFWDVKEGCILFRGKDIRSIPLSLLMANISMVFQRVYLFQDTIYNNIALGRTDATEEEVYAAARKAQCLDFIEALPEGFQTVIGEGGATLSGGEQQRLSIARCILKDAPIVILDEATASVDADNERQIQAAINELVDGKTLLVIAHRLHTIAKADQILVIADGSVAEEGTHDELLRNKGLYNKMVTKRASMRSFTNKSIHQ